MGQRARTSSSFRNSTHKEWKIYTFSPPIWRQCIIRYLESRYRQSYRLLKFWGNLAWWHHEWWPRLGLRLPHWIQGASAQQYGAEHQASASERFSRASASFTGSPVSDPCTLLSSPPEINALSLTISYPFQKWYCGISQNTLQKYTHAKMLTYTDWTCLVKLFPFHHEKMHWTLSHFTQRILGLTLKFSAWI